MARTLELEKAMARILRVLITVCRRFSPWPMLGLAALMLAGCHSLRLLPSGGERVERVDRDPLPQPPGKRSLRVSQYVFLSDFELQADLPLFRDLADLRDQVYKELQLPTANTVVQVYLFEDQKRYERFMKARYPDLPKRRAFFVAQPRGNGYPEDLLVYTYWGDRVQQDLRHELTHALLHSVLKGVPLWLDEGLAEYFEVPPSNNGLNHQHLNQLRRVDSDHFKANLAELEDLGQVAQMTPVEYREAWAWVHLMLRSKPEARAVLLNYLQQLRTNPNPGPLRPRLATVFAEPEIALASHVDELEQLPTTPPTAQR